MLSNIIARFTRASNRRYSDLDSHFPQNLSPQEKAKIPKLLKKLTRDPSDQQLLSPKQLHALRIAFDDFTTNFQPSDENIALLDILKTGEAADHFSDEEKKAALRAYLSAIEVIKEICDPTDLRLYRLSILLRLGYVTSGFCTIFSSIRNVADKFEFDKDSYPNLGAQITAGVFNGIANFVFTGQLLDLLKATLPEIKNYGINYRTARGVCYGFAGLIAISPSVVQMLHTEKTFPLPIRYLVAGIISGTLLPMYSKDGLEFCQNMVKPAYDRLEAVGLIQSCRELLNYANQNKSKILLLMLPAYTLGGFHTSNYIRGELDFFKPNKPLEIAIKAVTGIARIPFIAVVTDNAINAIKHRGRSDYCSSKSFFVACCILVSCLCSSLVTFAQCDLDLDAASFFLLSAAAIFGFLKSVKNFLTTNQVPVNSFNKLFRELETSDSIELGKMTTNSQTPEAIHLTKQIKRHLSLDLPIEQPKPNPRQPHKAGSERRHSAGW